MTFGLAVPVNPMWLSLIWANRRVGRVHVRPRARAGDVGEHLAADDGQSDRRAEPGAVPDQLAPAHLCGRASCHGVTTTVRVHERVDRQM